MLEQAPQLLRLAWPSVGSLILDQVGLPCKFYTFNAIFSIFPRNPIALRPFAVSRLLEAFTNYQATGLTTIFFVAALDDEYLLGSVP